MKKFKLLLKLSLIILLSFISSEDLKAQDTSNNNSRDSFSYLTELDAELLSFIIPPCAIDVELNKLIKENFSENERLKLYENVSGVHIKLKKSGRVKKVYWNDETINTPEKIKMIVKYFKELKYYNNSYRDEDGNILQIRETYYIFGIDSSGILSHHMWGCSGE